MEQSLTFDDVLVKPGIGKVEKRSDVFIRPELFISSPMLTVTGEKMCLELQRHRLGIGCNHRFRTSEEIIEFKKNNEGLKYYQALSLNDIDLVSELYYLGQRRFIIDVAHGASLPAIRFLEKLERLHFRNEIEIISGNIATSQEAQRLYNLVEGFRVGIGSGSLCTTRINTGVGVGQISALMDIRKNVKCGKQIVVDGGIRYPGDVIKAVVAGANRVMLGSVLAGTKESPGEILINGITPPFTKSKRYAGSASYETKHSVQQKTTHIEGVSHTIPYKGSMVPILTHWIESIQSGVALLGYYHLHELAGEHHLLVQITNATHIEGQPHGTFNSY